MSHDDRFLALQYVLGELTEAECHVFEARMADDLALCEEVVRAQQLCDAVSVVSRSCSPSVAVSVCAPAPWLRSNALRWMSQTGHRTLKGLALAAVLLLGVVGYQVLSRSRENGVVQQPSAPAVSERTLALWSQPGLLGVHDQAEGGASGPASRHLSDRDEPADGDDSDADDFLRVTLAPKEIRVQSWLLAAVHAQTTAEARSPEKMEN